MADITKRSNGSYRVRFLSVYGKRESKTFKDALTAKRFKAEAEIVETNIKTGVVTLQPAIPKAMSELFTYWMENRAVLKRKPKDDQSIIKRHLEEHFASLLIKNVNVEVLDRFNAVLRQKGLSAKTISNILTLLGSMIRLAHELEWITKVPKIKKPSTKEFSKEYSYLKSEEEIHRFLLAAKAEDEYLYTLYFTSLTTGMRQGEVAGLTWDCIDFNKSLITVRTSFGGPTKNKLFRYVPLQDELKEVLLKWRSKNPCAFVFPNKNDKMHKGSAFVFQEKFKEVLKNAGFPTTQLKDGRIKHYIVYHDLRHTFASHWMMRGGDLFELQRILGHKDISQTQRYTHLAPDSYARRVQHLSGLAISSDSNIIAFKRP